MYYQVPLEINKQEDGLWRVDAPSLQGCWVDAGTLEEALSEIQEVIAMVIDAYQEESWPLPKEVTTTDILPLQAIMPVAVGEHKFRRVNEHAKRKTRR